MPLNFGSISDRYGLETCFIQEWHVADVIRLQAWSDNETDIVTAVCENLGNGESTVIDMVRSVAGDAYYFDGAVTMLEDGIYKVVVEGGGLVFECQPFAVTSSRAILEDTSLIRFTSTTDILPFFTRFDGGTVIFQWRVPAGLKPNGYQPKISDEAYRTQLQEQRHLYSVPYSAWALTVGDAVGVPYWYAELLNKVMCLDRVNLDDFEIIRSDSDVPELTETYANSQAFIIRQNVELIDGAAAYLIRENEYDNEQYNNDYTI